jgi:hypothetical protein
MTPEARQRRLESLVREARGRAAQDRADLASRKDQPAAAGDLFVLAATADLPVEWAVLDRDAGSGELLAVPADAHPLAGSADVAAEPDGSLVLRCRFGVWLPPAVFKANLRTGVLAEEDVTAARHRWRQLERGEVAASPLAEEVDADPEYRDWLRDVPERARSLALRLKVAGPASSGGSAWPLRLAAILAVAVVGLSVWVVHLRWEVEGLTEPGFVGAAEVVLGEGTRGEIVLVVPRESKWAVLHLMVDPSTEFREGFLEVVDREGGEVWRSGRERLPESGEFPLSLPRSWLPDGVYFIRLYPAAGFDSPPLASERLRVETAE